jgi:hypothetical protein
MKDENDPGTADWVIETRDPNTCSFCGYKNVPNDGVSLIVDERASVCSDCIAYFSGHIARAVGGSPVSVDKLIRINGEAEKQ